MFRSIFSKNALSSYFGLSDEADNYDDYEEPAGAAKQKVKEQQTFEPLSEKPSARYRSTETKEAGREKVQGAATNEQKVVSMHNNQKNKRSQDVVASEGSTKIAIIEPRVYSESMNIAKYIIAEHTVLINFHLLEENQARRILDFITGTVYALDGDIQRVGDEIFLCTPSSMEIDSTTAQSIVKKQIFDFS